MDALHEYAQLAVNVLLDLVATGRADESLASLAQHEMALRREQRYAAQALDRALCKLASGQAVSVREPVDEALHWARCAARWASFERARANDLEAGCCIERALTVVSMMDTDACRHLRELLRAVVSELRRQLVAVDGEAVARDAA